MAHFAQLDDRNVVLQVIVVRDEDAGPPPGLEGEAFCAQLLGGRWKQTSYNTRGNAHRANGVPLRGNYAVVGGQYDPVAGVFVPPAPYASWRLNPTTWDWEPPVPHPRGVRATWDDATQRWIPT